jgi:hypothetical protein
MTIVNDLLNQMPGLGQPQRKFLATLFVTILVLRGRVNFRTLSRYCDYSERTLARQFREPFDWPDFHQRVLRTALDPCAALVSAHDASFIPKRRSVSGTSSTAVRVVPNEDWRLPRSL